MVAWRRGMLPTAYNKYGTRDMVRRELVLSMAAAELDADAARGSAMFASEAYGPHIKDAQALKKFLKRQSLVMQYAFDRMEYRHVDYRMTDPEYALKNNPTVQRMIEEFNRIKAARSSVDKTAR